MYVKSMNKNVVVHWIFESINWSESVIISSLIHKTHFLAWAVDLIINKAITESKININDIDGIAVTAGPGLIVCLTVGLSTANAIAASLNKPLIAVNHLEGHALSAKISKNPLLFLGTFFAILIGNITPGIGTLIKILGFNLNSKKIYKNF